MYDAQILEHIVTFLPKSDLLECTFVNTTWEQEARKYLPGVYRVLLIPPHVSDNGYQKTITLKNASTEREGFADFIAKNGPHVRTLEAIIYHQNPAWNKYLSKLFPNLYSLKLNVSFIENNALHEILLSESKEARNLVDPLAVKITRI